MSVAGGDFMTNKDLKRQAWKNIKKESSGVTTASIICIIIDGGLIGISSCLSAFFPLMYGAMVLFGLIISKMVVGKARFYMKIADGKDAYVSDIFSFFGDDVYARIKYCYLRKFAVLAIFMMIVYYGVMIIIFEFTGINNVFGYTYIHYYYVSDLVPLEVLIALFMIILGSVLYIWYGARYMFLEYIIVDKYLESKKVFIKDFKHNGYGNFIDEIFVRNSRLMDGNLLRAVRLMLSFSGWFVLSVLTCGFGFVVFIPYYNETVALFYKQERDNYNRIYGE